MQLQLTIITITEKNNYNNNKSVSYNDSVLNKQFNKFDPRQTHTNTHTHKLTQTQLLYRQKRRRLTRT